MKIQPYVSKLHSSPVYKEFQQKFKDAFLVAGFFVIDFETGNNLHQIDYYVPSKKKFAAFTLDKQVQFQLLNALSGQKPMELDIETKIDLEALNGIIQDEMKNRSITQTIKKMIAIIQNLNGKKVWNVNCVLSGMDILRVHVDDGSRTILKMERSPITDYLKKMPAPEAAPKKMTKDDIEKQIAQLDKMKDALKQEEVKLDSPPAESTQPAVKKASTAKDVEAIRAEKSASGIRKK